jgi:hypothetical protein
MTVEEAFALFPDPENFEDQLDEHLFGYKQFFLTNPILTATFKSRLIALFKMNDAAKILGIDFEDLDSFNSPNAEFSPFVETSILLYFEMIAAQKLKISQSTTPRRLIHEVSVMLNVHRTFCSMWVCEYEDDKDVLLSKPMDEVDFIQSIKRCSAQGILTFEDLKRANLSEEPVLLKEMKRLSLQHKKEQEWMSAMQS